MSQLVGHGPSAHGGGVNLKTQATMNFGGGKAVRSRRAGGQEFAHECFGALGPVRRVIAARLTRSPAMLLMSGSGTQVIGIKFVEAGSAQSELFGGQGSGQFAASKSGENFTNQRCAQAVGQLAIMFFIAAKMQG